MRRGDGRAAGLRLARRRVNTCAPAHEWRGVVGRALAAHATMEGRCEHFRAARGLWHAARNRTGGASHARREGRGTMPRRVNQMSQVRVGAAGAGTERGRGSGRIDLSHDSRPHEPVRACCPRSRTSQNHLVRVAMRDEITRVSDRSGTSVSRSRRRVWSRCVARRPWNERSW